jgi:hypothetical protein
MIDMFLVGGAVGGARDARPAATAAGRASSRAIIFSLCFLQKKGTKINDGWGLRD